MLCERDAQGPGPGRFGVDERPVAVKHDGSHESSINDEGQGGIRAPLGERTVIELDVVASEHR